ncbi:MAG TPA: hypothetical protein VMU77_02140 [Acidimicrobiales bacterium]|nr:hypothetical protein [Acidimicrobiales bacterium]
MSLLAGNTQRPTLSPHLAEAVRPTSLSNQQTFEIAGPVGELLPSGKLKRGSTIVITGHGATSLALSLASGPSRSGSWCASLGMGDLNPQAVQYAGLDLSAMVFVPASGKHWDAIVTTLITDVDIVLARPTGPVSPAVARRLATQARLHRNLLIVVSPIMPWPEAPDLMFTIESSHWEGLADGAGHLRRRSISVVVSGRRSASRASHHHLFL